MTDPNEQTAREVIARALGAPAEGPVPAAYLQRADSVLAALAEARFEVLSPTPPINPLARPYDGNTI